MGTPTCPARLPASSWCSSSILRACRVLVSLVDTAWAVNMGASVLRSSLLGLTLLRIGWSIKCYQCSSTEDRLAKPDGVWPKDPYSQDRFEDNCGVYYPFQPDRNIPVECNSDESHTPGTFCVKIVKQGPRGFIWDGRWRQVIRRCASVSDTGVTGVCNWGVMENGVYWEECYCSQDGCNAATNIRLSSLTILPSVLLVLFMKIR